MDYWVTCFTATCFIAYAQQHETSSLPDLFIPAIRNNILLEALVGNIMNNIIGFPLPLDAVHISDP